jgi:hypothetical protein
MKTILKRPWVHHVIIWGYIVAPVANVLLVSVFLHVPVATVVQRLARGYGTLGAAWLLSAPLMGIALYLVNRVVWYLFLAHSSLVFVDVAVKWVAKPLLFLHTIPPLNHLVIACGNLALVGLVGYIIQRDFRAPYFQVLQRSFREHRRLPIRHMISLGGVSALIDDLSITGCFVPAPVAGPSSPVALKAGDDVVISFRGATAAIETRGRVMRVTPGGWGIRFLSLDHREKKDLRRLLRNRYGLRYLVDLPAEWTINNEGHTGRLFDVSTTGCFVATDAPPVDRGVPAAVAIDVEGTRMTSRGMVVWLNRAARQDKPAGFGFHFGKRQSRLVRLVKKRLGRPEMIRT